ncbi:MAG: peptidoglycan-binding protein, partial [Leptolyngbyaceae cyanobacterium SL_7_1]|nr:peptidoglycan-binding protein [Leptolyngbyaceae cyanobacterium SL_7_1]
MDLQSIATGKTTYTLRTIQTNTNLVRAIETALIRLGFARGTGDGTWDRNTDAAYRAFSTRYGFETDQLSPKAAKTLLGALGVPAATPSPTQTIPANLSLQAIAQGNIAYPISTIRNYPAIVQPIQTALNRLGFSAGTADGVWGSRTETAYRAFALRYGFRQDELSPRAASFILSSVGVVTPTPTPTPAPVP